MPRRHPTRVCTLRAGVVLGRRGGLVQQTILPFYFGLGGRMGPGDQFMPWIHVKVTSFPFFKGCQKDI